MNCRASSQDHYTIFVRFPQAPAVTIDTPIHKSGILVGRVTDVDLLEDGNVVVTASISDEYRSPQQRSLPHQLRATFWVMPCWNLC